jgi:hypothetical protein
MRRSEQRDLYLLHKSYAPYPEAHAVEIGHDADLGGQIQVERTNNSSGVPVPVL